MINIKVNASKLVTNEKKCEMSREKAIEYAKDKMIKIIEVFDFEPTSAEINMSTEGEKHDPVQKVTMRLAYKMVKEPVVQSAHSRNIERAINRTVEPMERQLRKMKTKKVDKRRKVQTTAKHERQKAEKEAANKYLSNE